MLASDYSVDVSGATCGSLETRADLQNYWEWQPFSDMFASCNTQLLAEGIWSGIAISALSSGLHLLFFIWEEISLHLPWKANVHKQSGLKQRNQVQGQINSTAVIRKQSTVFLVLTHSRRSDLIGSRLDLYVDLETPKVWEFTSGVLAIGLKAGKIGEKGLFSNRGKTRSRKMLLRRGMTGRNVCPFIAQCCFSRTYIFWMLTTLPLLLVP